jgi:CHASE3 domain sensor protein
MTSGPPEVPTDPEQLRAQIEQTREQLGETVDELAAKTDVKGRAQAKAAELTDRAKAKTSQAREQAAAASEAVPDSVKRVAVKGSAAARQNRKPLAITVGVLIVGAVVIRWWTRR